MEFGHCQETLDIYFSPPQTRVEDHHLLPPDIDILERVESCLHANLPNIAM
jgi:hypothetical protein